MPMTKRHFAAIAAAVNAAHTQPPERQLFNLMLELARICKTENPRFDADRFYEACGYDRDRSTGAVLTRRRAT